MILIYLDTNCINAREKDTCLNELEQLNREGIIEIRKTDVLDTELQEGKGYLLGLSKSYKFREDLGAGVFDSSRFGHAVFGNEDDSIRLTRLLNIIFGNKDRSKYKKNEIRDAMHISTSVKHKGDFFITNERRILSASKIIEREFGLKVRNPQECLKEVKKLL